MRLRSDSSIERAASGGLRPTPAAAHVERQASVNATLRPATAVDAPRIAGLLIDTRAAFMPYAPSAHPDPELHGWVANYLVPSGGVTVAEFQGPVVAAMATERSAALSWITHMAVDPALVGRGIGSLLLARAMRTLAPPIRLYTFQANSRARRFYERHGFRPIELTDGRANEERCPDVLYELKASSAEAQPFAVPDVLRLAPSAFARGRAQTSVRATNTVSG